MTSTTTPLTHPHTAATTRRSRLPSSSTTSLHISTDLPSIADEDNGELPHPHYTTQDITSVQRALTTFLPVELADAILDMAEFWPWIAVSRNSYTSSYSALEGPDEHAQWCYLVSPEVPTLKKNGISIPTIVKMVKFYIKAYESSWGEPHTSSQAQTWFEASILKAGGNHVKYDDHIRPNSWYANMAAPYPKYLHPVRKMDLPGSPVENPFDDERRWHVANTSQSDEWQEITWKASDQQGSEKDPISGLGRGNGFIESLSVGDRVVLMARALPPGWINVVFNVKTEIYYALASSYL